MNRSMRQRRREKNLPPGLLCATCGEPFRGRHASRTDDGWVHAVSCLEGDIPGIIGRSCAVDGCDKPHHSAGYCSSHWHRWRRHGDPLAGKPSVQPLEIEDVEWMAATGECLTGAARRLNRSSESLSRALERAGRRDLALTLASREGDWNSPGVYSRQGVA